MFQEYIIYKIRFESTTIKSFFLKPKNKIHNHDFLAGQFVNIKITLPDTSDELIRSYTLSNRPKEKHLRLTIKKEPFGKVSGYLHNMARVGDSVMISKPIGSFHLRPESDNPVVLISGGVGITPMLSIAEYIELYQAGRKVYFLHSSMNKQVQPMRKWLSRIKETNTNFQLSIFHSDPVDDERVNIDYDYLGHITKNHLPVDGRAEYFVCGPEGFMKNMIAYLKELEVDESKIYSETFGTQVKPGTEKVLSDTETKAFEVMLTKSNNRLIWKKGMGSLLELVESAGLKPDSSCRMGTCSTCQSKLIKGTYEYDPEPLMETDQDNILICCAKPTSDMEIAL